MLLKLIAWLSPLFSVNAYFKFTKEFFFHRFYFHVLGKDEQINVLWYWFFIWDILPICVCFILQSKNMDKREVNARCSFVLISEDNYPNWHFVIYAGINIIWKRTRKQVKLWIHTVDINIKLWNAKKNLTLYILYF